MSHQYKKGKSAEYSWTQTFSFERPLKHGEAVRRLGELVLQFATPDLPISGIVPGAGSEANRSQVVLALDPSNRYGTPTARQSRDIADRVAEELAWRPIDRHVSAARIIMGRLEGYGSNNKLHTMEEVAERSEEISSEMGVQLGLEEGDLFSLRYTPKGLQQWTEPGVMVTAEDPLKANTLDAMLELAHSLAQDRVVVELPGGRVGGRPHALTQVYETPREK